MPQANAAPSSNAHISVDPVEGSTLLPLARRVTQHGHDKRLAPHPLDVERVRPSELVQEFAYELDVLIWPLRRLCTAEQRGGSSVK
jgi:hypothetical protein